MSNPESDTIVFNATVSNDTNANKVLAFTDFRKQNVLDHAEDYYVRMFEAKIPIMSLPLFQQSLPNDSAGNAVYKMKVTIGNITKPLIPIQLNPLNGQVVFVFYIQQFLDSLNNALLEAHIDSGINGSAPKMIYDYNNDLLLFCISTIYYAGGVNSVPIFFNAALMYKFTGFTNAYIGSLDKEYQILYGSYFENYTHSGLEDYFGFSSDTIFMPSQSKFYKDLLEYQSIIVTTRSLKVNEQYVSSGNGDNQSLPILSEIPILFEDINSSKYLTFSQLYPKWSNINAFGPLKTVDLYAYFVGDDFKIYELYILPGQKFNVRLEFIRKNLVKHYIA